MNTGKIIGLIVVFASAVGVVAYFIVNKSTSEQFDSLVGLAKKSGKDIFDVEPTVLVGLRNRFLSKISKKNANEMIYIISKKESEMTASEKNKLIVFLEKIIGKKIKS